VTTKKLTRSKRKELRAKGQLKVPARLDEESKAAERRAEEEEASARVGEAHEEIAHRAGEDEADPAPAKKKPRDLTVLLIVALTAVAGLIVWLVQRGPSQPEAATASASASASARAPIILTAPHKPPPPPQGTTP
jgi:ferric-dicitrate binding protein FerR (iron transport regulator)